MPSQLPGWGRACARHQGANGQPLGPSTRHSSLAVTAYYDVSKPSPGWASRSRTVRGHITQESVEQMRRDRDRPITPMLGARGAGTSRQHALGVGVTVRPQAPYPGAMDPSSSIKVHVARTMLEHLSIILDIRKSVEPDLL